MRGRPVRAPVVVSMTSRTPASHEESVVLPRLRRYTSVSVGCWMRPYSLAIGRVAAVRRTARRSGPACSYVLIEVDDPRASRAIKYKK